MSDEFESRSPITRSDLISELIAIGVEAGQVLMLHASLSSIGYVIGGADSVVLALQEVLGADGTLIAFASWDHGPPDDDGSSSEAVREAYLRDPPAFDVLVSASARYVGRLPERIRTWPGAIRSDHPEASFVALGARARWLTADQPINHPYGTNSPLAKVLEAKGSILMLGAPLETITMLHHAEELANVPNKRSVHYSAPVKTPTGIEWREVHDINTSTGAFPYGPVVGDRDSFEVIAEEALAAGIGRERPIGESRSVLFPARELVAFAVAWMEAHFV
ncbi:MAG: aminoglycoside 3-N-acetyltransferase [Actinomycetota bacterium]|nr:aminoglycoside 3-N-acetyltransferase [Actinomycetota bacterium]